MEYKFRQQTWKSARKLFRLSRQKTPNDNDDDDVVDDERETEAMFDMHRPSIAFKSTVAREREREKEKYDASLTEGEKERKREGIETEK